METEGDKNEEVTTSSSDVYATPIALGFEALSESSSTTTADASVVYGPPNQTEIEPSACLVTYNKDVRDMTAVRGRCGLYNLGNTCFMNAGLQCLMSTIPLVKFLLEYYQSRRQFDNTLFGQFQRLFAKVWSGQYSIVHPKDFKQTLGLYHTQFQDYRQHDCQEFLALLLDSLHEQLNFKSQSSNQNTEAAPSCEKQQITFEHNINNRALSNLSTADGENRVNDKSKNAATSHSSLTFDNMKESKSELSEKVLSNELKSECSEKRKSGSSIAGFTVNAISDDSNHSNISEQSSESEHCSVMKNLKLRSSPTASQSSVGLSPRLVNEFGEKSCDVSSSDDIKVDKNEIVGNCESSVPESFKRVHSLQDFRSKECVSGMVKASSDNDLVNKASSDVDEEDDFDAVLRMEEDSSQIDLKNNASAILKPEHGCDNKVHSMSVNEIPGSDLEPVVLNNVVSTTTVPSLDDLYAKETKTLNTNVLATEYMEEPITTDSDKFSKHDNTAERIEITEEDDLIGSVMQITTKTDGFEVPKKVKDVNIRADKKSKSPKGACGSNSGMNSEKEDCFALTNVKRMKFEGTEKNLQMQEICKIQKEALICESMKVQKPKNIERVEKISCTREASPSVDSDIESDMVDDQEEDNEMEVSDENEAEEMPPHGPRTLAEGACYTTAEVLAAEDAWQRYIQRNDSVVVDTFQGQFRSTVVCARCSQVSVTFEPFMYLSVPVPHAMERQLCVTFISLRCEPIQLLLDMHKQDKILKVKQELCNLIGGNPSDIMIAEVLDWHISRILEDNTLLRYINDSSRKIYAFEVDQSTAESMIDSNADFGEDDLPASSQDSTKAQADVYNYMGSYLDNVYTDPSRTEAMLLSAFNQMKDKDSQKDNESYDEKVGTGLWEWNTGGLEKRRGSLETEIDGNPMVDSTTPSGFDIAEDVARAEGREVDGEKTTVSSSTVTTDDWKSCAICLEEMPENELMVHTTCGGTFCSACLEMSAQHYRDSVYCCPVCSTPADMTEDFVPLTNAANHKPKTRIVAIPISYRCEKDISGADNPYLFAHPSLLNLPSNLTGCHIYSCIQKVKPDLQNFRILLTDGTGLRCSRCLYMEHCSGCEIPQNGEAILRPGDNLAVSVQSVVDEQVADLQRVTSHRSMEKLRSSDPVTLLDCFRAFTQSEELDENNPWFCPHCKENQRAKKTMTVWQYPDTLIIQLKRFVFHELSSTKVDNKVMFPLDNLDLNSFISGPKTKNLMYNLYSLVCHFGGANSGHYTSYAKHPEDGKWYYYNDETVTERSPAEDEFTSTYVLFYQRKGTDKALQIPDDLDLTYEGDCTENIDSSSIPSVVFQPPEEEITLNLDSTAPSTSCNITPSTSCQSDSSTSCHQVAASSDACDLLSSELSGRKTEDFMVDSSYVRAELAEADSTGPSFEFYS